MINTVENNGYLTLEKSIPKRVQEFKWNRGNTFTMGARNKKNRITYSPLYVKCLIPVVYAAIDIR